MIIRRALYQETSLATLAVTLILVLLFIFMGLTRLLGKAAIGEQAPDVIFILLSLELLRKIDLLLPLSLFIGLLLTLGLSFASRYMQSSSGPTPTSSTRTSAMSAAPACGLRSVPWMPLRNHRTCMNIHERYENISAIPTPPTSLQAFQGVAPRSPRPTM